MKIDYYSWVWWLIVFVLLVVILDEYAYKFWKMNNPGQKWSHLQYEDRPMTLVVWPWQMEEQ